MISEFWRLPRVKSETGMVKSAIYAKIASREFPRPLKISARSSAWLAAEINAWKAQKVAQRD